MLVVEVPNDLTTSGASNVQSSMEAIHRTSENDSHGQPDAVDSEESTSPKCSQNNHDGPKDVKSVRLDISFKSASHTGLQTTELVILVQNMMLYIKKKNVIICQIFCHP